MKRLNISYLDRLKNMESIDVSGLLEDRVAKGGKTLGYLPWVEANLLLDEHYPNLSVQYERDAVTGHPYFKDTTGYYILVYIEDVADGSRSDILFYPVMDNNHNALVEPNMNQINTSLLRAGVKVIALVTGIGLDVFRKEKEDVPTPTKESYRVTDKEQAFIPIANQEAKPANKFNFGAKKIS